MSINREVQVIIFLILFSVILWFIQNSLTQNLYTKTPTYQLQVQQIKILKDQNLDLRNQLLKQEAYTTIASEAAQMGFAHAAILVPL